MCQSTRDPPLWTQAAFPVTHRAKSSIIGTKSLKCFLLTRGHCLWETCCLLGRRLTAYPLPREAPISLLLPGLPIWSDQRALEEEDGGMVGRRPS